MPGRETPSSKSDYPSCNRAFALRMMNPTCYTDERTSPLDKEIQPLGKKFVAKTAILSSGVGYHRDSTELLSVDEISLSPASSCASSLNEMELYDIDEAKYGPEQQQLQRQRSSLESNNLRKNMKNTKGGGALGMVRSYSSAGGFDGGYFNNRGTPSRSSVPSRPRNKTSPKDNKNGYREEATAFLKQHRTQSASPKGTQSANLRRTQSLKGARPNLDESHLPRPRSTTGIKSPSSASKVRVATTKSSQLRAKALESKHRLESSPQPQKMTRTSNTKRAVGRTSSNTTPKSSWASSLNSTEEESDGSVFSEVDAYRPRHNPRGRQHEMKPSSPPNRKSQTRTLGGGKVSPTTAHAQNTPQVKRLLNTDTFSDKLNDVCRLISERHPGDFQILETLTEMQSAYEERNDLVRDTISNLREKVRILEYKNANAPNIPGLVIPLMRATNAFQTQLQSIMDAYHRPGIDAYTQHPVMESQQYGNSSLDQISEEANQVASQIEKHEGGLGANNQAPFTKSNSRHTPTKEDFIDEQIQDSTGSDKENICSGEHHDEETPSSALDSYTIISENPVTV